MLDGNQLAEPMSSGSSSRPLLIVLVLGMACAWLGWRVSRNQPAPLESTTPSVADPAAGMTVAAPASALATKDSTPATPPAPGPVARRSSPPAPTDPEAPVSPRAKSLIDSIFREGAEQALTRQRSAEIRETLRQLQAEGPAALSAIGEFLAKAQDLPFTGGETDALKGQPTLRAALLDIVAGFGGTEAQDLLLTTLRSTAEPAEIQRIARHLEAAVPGEHVAAIVEAARETLKMAQAGEIHPADIGPVFNVLRQHGGSDVVGDLEASLSKWGHYSAIALASTPEGIDIVLNQVRDSSPRKPAHYLFSFQVLAQNAHQQEAAANGLVDLARDNLIPDAAWPQITQGLLSNPSYDFGRPDTGFTPAAAGATLSGWKTFSVSQSGQFFYSQPLTSANADVVRSRLELIDRLLATTTQPAARTALEQARTTLGGVPKSR